MVANIRFVRKIENGLEFWESVEVQKSTKVEAKIWKFERKSSESTRLSANDFRDQLNLRVRR